MARPSNVRTCTRVSGAVIALVSAGVLAACSGSSSGGGAPSTQAGTPTDTTSAPATVTTSAPAPGTHSATHSGPTSARQPASGNGGSSGGGSGSDTDPYCKESQLQATIEQPTVPGSGKHGRKAVIVDFRNTSNSTCVLYGYPGAAVLNASKQQVTQAKRTVRGDLLGYAPGHNTLVHVSLKPGAVAKAGIEGTDQQEQGAAQAGCDGTSNPQIEVTPPNTKIAVPFDVTWPVCYSFTVHPVNYN